MMGCWFRFLGRVWIASRANWGAALLAGPRAVQLCQSFALGFHMQPCLSFPSGQINGPFPHRCQAELAGGTTLEV